MAQVNSACDSNAHRDGLQIPDLCDDACATAYLPVYDNCHDILQSVADQQGRRSRKVMRQFDHLAEACREAHVDEGEISAGNVHVDGATYFITDGQQLVQGNELQPIDIPLDYDIGLTITPGDTVAEWSNLVHISATGENCCNYGDRVPAIYFHPGTHRLHIRDGSTDNGNDGCDPEEELQAGVPTNVRVEIRATSINVYFNDVNKCQGERGARLTQTGAHVYASDPWYPPANAVVSNFYLVCDSDTATPGLQAEPDEDPISVCSAASAPAPPAVVETEHIPGATYLIRSAQPLAQAFELPSVDLPEDFDLGFSITPTATNVDGWANIVHLSASGENCCDYGDRVPGIWFFPGTKRLHIRDGDASGTGNEGCDPEEELQADVSTAIRLEVRSTSVEVFFNDVSKCQSDRSARASHDGVHVWASDPWHTTANAEISYFYIVCDSDAAADGLQPGTQPSCNVGNPPPPPDPAAAAAAVAAAGSVPGALYLITDEQPITRANELQPVDLPLDYDVGFTLNPSQETVDGWSNVIHVSASGENCCDYGDRIPGIWMYANSHRLHVRDGSTENGNDGCDPREELTPGVATAVRLEIRATSTELFFNGESKCHSPRDVGMRTTHSAAHVWASDPWHEPSLATISNFYMVCDNDIETDGLQGGATCANEPVKTHGGH